MDQAITQGYENGGDIIHHSVTQHTENMDVDKQVFLNDPSNLAPNYGQSEFDSSTQIQTENMEVSVDAYKDSQNEASAYVETAPNPPVQSVDNESLDNIPGEPFIPLEEKPQVNSEESFKSAYMLEHQSENTYMPEQSQEQQSFAVVEEVNTGAPEEKQVCDSAVNDSVSTDQYVESNDGNFVSQYESENAPGDKCAESEETNPPVDRAIEPLNDIKVEYAVAGGEIDSVVEDQALNEDIVTEVVEEESLYIVDENSEPVEGASSVKEESSAMEVTCNDNLESVLETQTGMEVVEETVTVEEAPNLETETVEAVPAMMGNYTIVEGPGAVEITVTHSGDTSVAYEEVTEVEIQPGCSKINLTEETDNADPGAVQPSPARGRRVRRNEIPMHLLGVDISKPVDQPPNGRPMPKPRLGVKVPYRNLTSQIISKEELEKEIIDRSRAKEEAATKSDLKFARSLTQRLASKIAPPEKGNKKGKRPATEVAEEVPPANDEVEISQGEVQNIPIEEQMVVVEKQVETETVQMETVVDDTKIQNDDDLLAILEGEGEEMPVLPKEVQENNENDGSNLKMLEREIALQQLQELPHQVPKQRIFKSRQAKTASSAAPILTPQTSLPKQPKVEKTTAVATPQKHSKSEKQVKSTPTPEKSTAKLYASPSPRKDAAVVKTNDSPTTKAQPVEVEPQVKVNMVLKTYSRKRKTSDAPIGDYDAPSPKRVACDDSEFKPDKADPLAIPTDVYVTKSSRVIKKKVIWDPDDDTPARSPKPTVVKLTDTRTKASESAAESAGQDRRSDSRASDRKLSSDSRGSDKKIPVEKISPGKKVSVAKTVEKRVGDKVSPKKAPLQDKPKAQVAAKNESPKTKTPVKSKRGLSEVDRLLMDEGAVKMLYDLKTPEDSPAVKKKKDFISIEKAEKEIIKRANQLKNDLLVQNSDANESSPKTLRKKEGPATTGAASAAVSPTFKPTPTLERKMSKDSTRSSVHTPPRSPTFQFSGREQGSMLIRRRSSSSISSAEEDVDDDDADFVPKTGKKKFDGPKAKKAKKIVGGGDALRQAREAIAAAEPEMSVKESPNKYPPKMVKVSPYKSFTVRKSGKQIVVDLNYIDEKCFFDCKVLDELTAALKKCAKDKDCAVVSLTSTSKAFCLGLDYGSLVSGKENERLEKATELADKVRDFLLCLLNFPKILIAGVQGDCVGLGVTMLPLFDMVIASDKATFGAAYASLGCMPEAGFLLSSYPNLSAGGLATELLYAGHTLKADEALRRGLISKLCWPEKYKDALKNIVTSVARGSKQCLEATKRQLRSRMLKEAEAAIKSEKDILVEHWTSAECQENFSRLSSTKVD